MNLHFYPPPETRRSSSILSIFVAVEETSPFVGEHSQRHIPDSEYDRKIVSLEVLRVEGTVSPDVADRSIDQAENACSLNFLAHTTSVRVPQPAEKAKVDRQVGHFA